ncbi:uncharacterized protein LOC130542811 [Ursus arctos]|uniref:uncharacterized protein LOC130542811 n=1 Tax=Ursus arctos TaxID=9644 RepID=UPI002546CD7D|nr:uncharacterized protein LOC130542811 [Ursus arctos]
MHVLLSCAVALRDVSPNPRRRLAEDSSPVPRWPRRLSAQLWAPATHPTPRNPGILASLRVIHGCEAPEARGKGRSFSPRILRARLGPHPAAGRKALQTLSTWGRPLPASQPLCLSPKPELQRQTSRQGWFPQQKPQRTVGRKLPWPRGLRKGTAGPAAPLRGPRHEGLSGTRLDRQQPGRAPTSTPTGPPWSAGCCQQSLHQAVVRLLPTPQAPCLALRRRPNPVSGSRLSGIRSLLLSPGSGQHMLASFLWTHTALSCGWNTAPHPGIPAPPGSLCPHRPSRCTLSQHPASFLRGHSTPPVRSAHDHFSPLSTVTSSRQDLRLSAPCCPAESSCSGGLTHRSLWDRKAVAGGLNLVPPPFVSSRPQLPCQPALQFLSSDDFSGSACLLP